MAGKTGNPSSPPSRGDRPAVAPSPGKPAGFALLPQGKYLGKPPIALSRPVIVVGSNSNCRVQLRSESVSKVHALLVKSGNTYYIRDLASRAHVYVDDQRVREHTLRDGEVLKIGSFLLKFVAPAGASAEPDPSANASPILPASLVPQGGEMPIPVEERGLLIGRRPGSDVPLLEASASSSHAVVFEMDGQHYIRDLGSRTGTFVNGVKVHQHCLNGNDLVRIGETTLRYKPSPETVDDEHAADESIDAVSARIGLVEPELTENLRAEHAPLVPPPLSPEVHPSVSQAGDDFGLELLPSNEAPAGHDEHQTVEQTPSVPPLPVAKTSDLAKESSGPILPGRRGWRAIVPDEQPAVEAPASAQTDDRHVDELDLPLAPDVSSVPDPVADEPATTSSADAGSLDLMKFADEDTSSVRDVDFDENSLVNERSAPADVIDFDLDWEPGPTAEPLLSPDGAAEIAAAEEAEEQRKEGERREAERLEQEQAAAQKAEAERVAAEEAHARQVEAEREASQRAWAEEAQRVATEKAEAERLDAERLAAAKAEADRVAAEKAEADRVEAERVAAEKAEAERLETERLAAELAEAERLEAERIAAEKAEAERLEAERAAAEKAEADRIAAEKAEADRIEAGRVAAEKAQAERLEAERLAAEKAEAERVEAERLAAEKAEADRIAAEQAEVDRIAAEKAEAERLEAERAAAERAEAERLEAERVAAEKAEAQRLEAERLAAEKAEADRLAAEKAEAERVEAERLAAEKAQAERIEAERLAEEKAAAEKAEAERLAAEEAEAKRVEAERLEAELAAATGRIDEERIAAERAESERLISESLAGDETIEKTEPSPESAFDFNAIETHESGDALPDSPEATNLPYFDAAITASLSDSSFGRAIEDFTGDVSGVLVEPPADHAAEGISHDQQSEISSELLPVEPSSLDSHEPDSALVEPSLADSFLPELSLPDSIDSVLADEPPKADADADFFDEFVAPRAPEDLTLDAPALEEAVTEESVWPDLEQPVAQHPVAEHPIAEHLAVDGDAAFVEPIEHVESAIAPASELDLSKLVEQENQSAAQTEFESTPSEDDWEPLPSGDVAAAKTSEPPPSEPPSSAPRSSPIKPLFPMAEIAVGGAFAPWGGNQENYFGGKPLKLPPMPRITSAPQTQKVEPPKVAPPKIEQPATRVEQPKQPAAAAPVSDEDEHIDSVSAMIDEILIGEAKPSAQTKTPPFSQVSRPPMGSTPQQFRAAPTAMPTPATPVPMSRAVPAKPGTRQFGGDLEEPTAGPISATPATRRPLRRGLADMVEQQQKAAARIDEQIPPFGTPLPDALTNRRKSEEPEPLESLAKPPVQETDVFAHTSPSSGEESASDDDLPFVEDALAPTGRGKQPGAATPMDLVFDETNGSRNLSRRVRGGTRFPSPAASTGALGAGAAAGIGAAIGRVSLPNDPFWSGAPQATVANSSGSNGNGGMEIPPIAAMADALPPRGRHAVRPSVPSPTGFRPTKQVASRMPDFAYATAEDHSEAITRRKRLHRLVPVLMLVGLGLIAADLAAIWKLLPPKSIVDARITFEHLGNKSELDRHSFINVQNDLLKSDLTRRHAIESLSKQNPEIAPGFLDNETEYGRVADSATWPDQSRNVMQISRVGTDADGDIPRVKAMAIALHDGNGVLIDEAQRNQGNLDEAQSLIDQDRKTEDDLQKQCDEARAIADGRPSVAQMNQLQADQDQLEKEWKASVAARDTAEADLQRLQATQGQTGDGASASPDAAVVPMASDDQTRQMQSQLDVIKAQMDAAKAARIKEAQEARAALDASLAQFEQQVSDAKALSKDNPELTAYISAAQKFQETTRGLVDDLMRRQQQQYGQLTELQGRLSDKMDARRQEMWQKDETLQKMNDQLEYAKRQLNAALGTGQEKEAADLKAEVELLESTIKAREDLIPADPFYTDAIDQLQKIVDQQQKAMQEDRQTTAKALDDAQSAFAQSQPAVDKLPAEQKSLASEMEKRLADINAARAKYNDAANAVGDGSDDATKKLADQVATLTASIDAHRKMLADATLKNEEGASQAKRSKDIEDKKAEIVTLTKAAKDAEDAYTGKENDLQAAQASLAKARAAGDQLQALNDQRQKIDAQMQQLLDDIKFKQDAVNTSVEPLMITDADIHRHAGADNRLFYATTTGTPIVVLFMGLILWTIHAASRELPLNALSPSDDDGPEPFSLPALEHASENGSNSNGETNGHESEEVLNSLTGSVAEGEDGEGQDDLRADADLQLDADSELDSDANNGTGPHTDQQPADAVANN